MSTADTPKTAKRARSRAGYGNSAANNRGRTDPPEFEAMDFLTFDGSDVVTTKLDRDCNDFVHLIDQRIVIDGVEFVCLAVQYPNPGPPFRKGEFIAITLRTPKTDAF